jgi:hypothetical protein
MADGRRGRGAELIGRMLPGTIPTLLPKLRKVQALKLLLQLLPPELAGLAAPHEIRLAPALERYGKEHDAAGEAQLSTLFVYCASATVAAVVEQQAPRLLAELNARLPYPLAEALRCERATAQKIAQQLNNLALGPD